jgi:hypothetical protein
MTLPLCSGWAALPSMVPANEDDDSAILADEPDRELGFARQMTADQIDQPMAQFRVFLDES